MIYFCVDCDVKPLSVNQALHRIIHGWCKQVDYDISSCQPVWQLDRTWAVGQTCIFH